MPLPYPFAEFTADSAIMLAVVTLAAVVLLRALWRRVSGRGRSHSASGTGHERAAAVLRSPDSARSGRVVDFTTWQTRRLFSSLQNEQDDFCSENPIRDFRIDPEELPIPDDEFVFGALTPAFAQLLPETAERRQVQQQTLAAAGYHSRAAWLNLTAIRFVLAFLALIVIGVWLLTAPPALEPWLMVAAVVAPLVFWALPPLFVAMRASERRSEIERGLPDVLDMLHMCVSQGLTVPQSLQRIGREISSAHPVLSEELQIVDRQGRVSSLTRALKAFSARINSPDISSFTSLLIQSELTGSSILHSLKEYSDSIRSSLRERADARANAASFKLLFPVSLCLMPSVFLFLLGPAIIEMSDFFGNRAAALNNQRENAMDTLNQQPRIGTVDVPQGRL